MNFMKARNPYNIYCDESCHLENDGHRVMVLGAIWTPLVHAKKVMERIRDIKVRNGMKPNFEIKWTKVSKAKKIFYLDLIDYFFDDDDLHFRALVVPNKNILNHGKHKQDHDTWYYKMYFDMLKIILEPHGSYNIYLDIKDTRSADKVKKLHEVLCNSQYDYQKEMIRNVQNVHSHEIGILQLADLLIGAVRYKNENMSTNGGKNVLVDRIIERSEYSMTKSTLYRENKVNIFHWRDAEENVWKEKLHGYPI